MISPARRYVLALDSGTSSCRALAFDRQGQVVSAAQAEFTQHYPRPGWVEHDANEIWQVQERVMHQTIAAVGGAEHIAAIGITNQRETVVLWDKDTGEPLHPAIVWQCRRSTAVCERLRQQGAEPMFREKTGLLLDPYFSGTKLTWLFETYPDLYRKAARGQARFGTVDSWLMWQLSGGTRHLTDHSNASRTLLYNVWRGDWDEELLSRLGVPRACLPELAPSSGAVFEADIGGARVPVAGRAGDQQAALFGQRCFHPGDTKNTYGTGCFLLMNAGESPPSPEGGLLSTVAWRIGERTTYALEGGVWIAGAAVQWLRDGLNLIVSASETESLAQSVRDTGGVYFVPAFAGLGAPHWQPDARGLIAGLTRGTTRAHLIRATLEAIAYQTRDLTDAMTATTRLPLPALRVDGGAAANRFLMQFQADLLGIPVTRAAMRETTALGAAFLAGLGVGVWSGLDEIAALPQPDETFAPALDAEERDRLYAGWQQAVKYQVNQAPA